MCKVMAHVQHVRQMVLNLNNQVRNPHMSAVSGMAVP